MKTVTVKLPANLNARLNRAAKQRGQTKSAVVREAIETLLENRTPPSDEQSALERAGDLVGCLKGPTDLATNPKYMDGFGE